MDVTALVAVAVVSSLFISSVAGYGGSLVLVPALAAILGPREGIALAAVLLAWNNLFKVVAYRRTLPLRAGWSLVAVTAVGSLAGGLLLINLPDGPVYLAIGVVTAATLVAELVGRDRLLVARRAAAAPMMAASSVLSGISGTSGPLKGVAIRSFGLPRLEHVGLASLVSLAGDGIKAELFASAGLLADVPWTVVLVVVPLMPLAAWVGRAVNERMDERAFRWVFWSVVGGYVLRMLGLWA